MSWRDCRVHETRASTLTCRSCISPFKSCAGSLDLMTLFLPTGTPEPPGEVSSAKKAFQRLPGFALLRASPPAGGFATGAFVNNLDRHCLGQYTRGIRYESG